MSSTDALNWLHSHGWSFKLTALRGYNESVNFQSLSCESHWNKDGCLHGEEWMVAVTFPTVYTISAQNAACWQWPVLNKFKLMHTEIWSKYPVNMLKWHISILCLIHAFCHPWKWCECKFGLKLYIRVINLRYFNFSLENVQIKLLVCVILWYLEKFYKNNKKP